jgi:hypothetical protein
MSALPKTPELLIGMIHAPLGWELWPSAKAMLHPALMLGDEDWPEVERDLSTNAMQLWAVMEGGDLLAAAVTRVAQARDGKVAEVYLIGGADSRDWLGPLNDQIEESARDIGCIAMRAYGREGWKRQLGAMGWKVRTVAFELAL